jgi:prophage regulatory protein
MSRKLVSRKELKSVYGIPYSHQHILRLEKAGSFPKRVRLANYRRSRCAWLAEDVEKWIDSKLAGCEDDDCSS